MRDESTFIAVVIAVGKCTLYNIYTQTNMLKDQDRLQLQLTDFGSFVIQLVCRTFLGHDLRDS